MGVRRSRHGAPRRPGTASIWRRARRRTRWSKGITGEIEDKGFVVANLDKVVNWARTG